MKLGYFHLALHGHVPYVLNHGTWPHGEVWLQEATWETYIPLLKLFQECKTSGYPIKVTLNLSPILLEQISNQRFIKNFENYINEQIKYAKREEKEYETKEPIRSALAKYWISIYEKRKNFFENLGGDIIGYFKRLAEDGLIEIISCAATHGYLPLLGYDECVDAQVRVGLMTSKRYFSQLEINGFWLPECAYRSSYQWENQITGEKFLRKGLEMILYDNSIKFSYIDYHLLIGQEKVGIIEPPYESKFWNNIEKKEKVIENNHHAKEFIPLKPYYCVSPGHEKGVVFLVRDPIGTSKVWSRDMGFPGNGRYLEFHKRAFPGGHRFWRVTDKKLGLGAKEYYEPSKALEAISEHSISFVNTLQERSREALTNYGIRPIFVEVFDAELFGHWWHEGILWLKQVFRLIESNGLIEPAFGKDIFEIYERIDIAHLWEGSWGAGGDHRVWFNEETRWMWSKIYECEDKMIHELSTMEPKNDLHLLALNQAAKELLLLEASDWEFLYTTWQARDYAEQRFQIHYKNFIKTYELAKAINDGVTPQEEKVEEVKRIASDDAIFEGVDYRLWRPKR